MSGASEDEPWLGFEHLAERLSGEFHGVLSHETVQRLLLETTDLLGESRVDAFVPILVERFARERLQALARTEGNLMKDRPEVLFVCEHNAGRSQIAAALLERHAMGRVHVRSAGSTPAQEINPAVIEAMAEWEIDISNEFPKPLTDEVVRDADVVITMGCGDACPIYPGKRYLDWDLPDPSGKQVDEVRPIRDEIDRRVRQLLEELVPSRT
jgi:arsenate reductase